MQSFDVVAKTQDFGGGWQKVVRLSDAQAEIKASVVRERGEIIKDIEKCFAEDFPFRFGASDYDNAVRNRISNYIQSRIKARGEQEVTIDTPYINKMDVGIYDPDAFHAWINMLVDAVNELRARK